MTANDFTLPPLPDRYLRSRRRRRRLLVLLAVLLTGAASFRLARDPILRGCDRHGLVAKQAASFRESLGGFAHRFLLPESPPDPTRLARGRYEQSRKKLEQRRSELALRYVGASTDSDRAAVLAEARTAVLDCFRNSLFPAWYGTPWAFSGTSAVPGEDTIACGYFVSTTLEHAGFELDRYHIAQQASQKIIEVFADPEDVRVNAGKPVSDVVDHITASGPGLYLVGLDTHVGYVLYHDDTMRFVHSSYVNAARGVISEPVEGRNPLATSHYRVVGKVLGDEMMRKWLAGERFRL